MSLLPFQNIQLTLTKYLRNPDLNKPPEDVESRRVGIYRDLVYNNIEGFIASGFPVLREILTDSHWHAMIRDFVDRHESQSPYFLEISQEFLSYLQTERKPQNDDPLFVLELAHYEWVELALDVAPIVLAPEVDPTSDVLTSKIVVSPLVWSLSYRFPVHLIGPDYQPREPLDEPTFLLVFRNRQDSVEFIHSNSVTVRLLKILQEGTLTGREALLELAREMQHADSEALVVMGAVLLQDLRDQDVLWCL